GLYSNCPPASISQVRLFYQAIAPAYRRHVEPSRAHQLAAFVPLFAPGSRVLDASCGDGTFAKMAGKKLKVWCNDLSPAMLALIPRRLAPPSRRSVSSASRLPHPAASFDGVLHSFSNLHSFDRRAFASFFRVLRNGGLLAYHPVKAPGERWPPHFHARTLAALRKAGFHSVESKWLESAGKKKTRLRVYLARK
ncbi:MAG: methyltransferase domain-containing protein, partial [Candidatus Micrarchaeota archaeon]|nr:methyltransferase domain-containing protein [Candidatus Micrarchaeota archaeon]